jgi:hypothetical protein
MNRLSPVWFLSRSWDKIIPQIASRENCDGTQQGEGPRPLAGAISPDLLRPAIE